MKVLKRNQLIILVISLMLITSGYLNFTAHQNNISTKTIANRSDEAIGDAEFVSTIPMEDEKNIIADALSDKNIKEEKDTVNNENNKENNKENENNKNNETIETNVSNVTTTDDYYFTSSKLERNNMYSESLESYQEIYNNPNATGDSKKDAIERINKINSTKNSIMIAENLIIAKGFKDVVIFVNEGSISVVIKAEELKQEEVAQIQNIVSRELNVGAEIIHISNKQ